MQRVAVVILANFLLIASSRPALAAIKDFLRFHVTTSRGKIVTQLTSDSTNTFTE
jgi:hypothetical protein